MTSVGIDIGGTHLRCAIFDETGAMLDKLKIPNDQSASAEQNLDRLLDFFLARSYACKGIGVCCPGPVDIKGGRILNPPNLYGWDYFEIVRYIEEKTHVRTLLNNDANIAGLAEARLGAGKGLDSVFYVTVSTGVGGAFIYRGEIVCGATSTAGEVYNLIVNEDPHCHGRVNAGSLNEQCGGHGLARIALEAFGRPVDPRELFTLYEGGDETAAEIVEHSIDALAKGIANIACVVDPDLFILGGSIVLCNPWFIEKVTKAAKQYVIFPEHLRIAPARYGDDAGLLGASLLAG